jgi:malate dehydrogenase (oxaloacetate-decarboxylating)
LFYALALTQMTIGFQADAIANYSHLFRRSEGLFLSFANQESMEEDFLEEVKGRDVDLFVCSDAEAILGIGDQGVGVRIHLQY